MYKNFFCAVCGTYLGNVYSVEEKKQSCFHCNNSEHYIFFDGSIDLFSPEKEEKIKSNPYYNEEVAQKAQEEAKIGANKTTYSYQPPRIHCPVCNSVLVDKISTLDRAVSIGIFGLASGKIGKQYQCKSCKHRW